MLFLLFCTSCSAETRPRVVIIDSGLDITDSRFRDVLCLDGHRDFTGEGIEDYIGHGTHVAGLIKKYATSSNYCLMIVKYYSAKITDNWASRLSLLAFRHSFDYSPKMINYSSGGSNFDEFEYNLIRANPHTLVVAAAGNFGVKLSPRLCYYPACYDLPNIIQVGSLDRQGNRSTMSNYGSIVEAMEVGEDVLSTLPNGQEGEMSGTSMAAAVHTGKLIK